MEKVLYLKKNSGGKEIDFLVNGDKIELYDFTYDAKRMGGAPTITATVMYEHCLDKELSQDVFVEFNGEKYYLKNTPTSSKSNTDSRYKHELNFISERVILDNVYFYDIVSADFDDYKPVSNSSKFQFSGNIHQLVARFNQSLEACGLDYTVVVDNGIDTEDKLLSFDNTFFSNALQEIYNIFELPYYFVGKEIHIGYSSNQITDVLKYGSDSALLSITKQNTNNKIVNRITGVGSSENIPYYYPNDTEKGNIRAIAIPANGSSFKDEQIEIYNASLYGKYIDLTIDDNNVLPSSILTYTSAEIKIESKRVSTDSMVGWEKPNVDFVWYFDKNKKPIYVYVEVTFNVVKDGVVSINPKLYINNVIKPLSSEVECSFYRNEEDVPTYAMFDNGYFNMGYLEKGVWTSMFMYKVFYDKNDSISIFLAPETDDSSSKGAWISNGKQYHLDELGIRINGEYSYGDSFYQYRDATGYVNPQTNLMPSIYRETFGAERFYNAINYPFEYKEGYELKSNEYVFNGFVHNDSYKNEDGEYIEFNNPFIVGKPKEHIENFDDIKPTIKGATNSKDERIDMFADFAYDNSDNDETKYSEDGGSSEYKHPYFFAKLRALDFNLFDHAIENGEMTIAMTSGSCGACEFVIAVNDSQKNTVQVDDSGNLKRDSQGNVLFGVPQEKQNDTTNNEVWIALRKEDSSFGQIMPNVTGNLKPSKDDTFVILNILLPKEYIIDAEKRLEKALIDYMYENNSELFSFEVGFSRIYLAEHEDVLQSLSENSSVSVEYNGIEYPLYVSSYSYKMSSSQSLSEIKVSLVNKVSSQGNTMQNIISSVVDDTFSKIGNIDVLSLGLPYFVRKDINDVVTGKLKFIKGLTVGNYRSGVYGSGATLEERSDGNTYLEVDYATIRKKATFTNVTIQELKHIGGEVVLSPASIVCTSVVEKDNGYYCYFNDKDADGIKILQEFVVNDQARCQVFNEGLKNKYYWRLVTEVGSNYIVLSKDYYDKSSEDTPEAGDNIVQLGHRTIATRQNAQILSAYGDDAPSFKQYAGINSFSLEGKEVTVLSPSGNKITGELNILPNSTGVSNLIDFPEEVVKAAQVGGDNILKNSGFIGNSETIEMGNSTLDESSEMYSPSLMFWSGTAEISDDTFAKSGKSATLGDISQDLSLIDGESYTVSFFAKDGGYIAVSLGGQEFRFALSRYYARYTHTFHNCPSDATFNIKGYNATICDLKLERGTIATDWTPSARDYSKIMDNLYDVKYLQEAIRNGSTSVIGGLILSNILQLGLYKDNVMQNVTAGINGNYYDDDSVAFWAGGDLSNAINTIARMKQNQQISDDEWNDLANFVATHGGAVFMRGYLNALGISLRGKIETSVEGNKLVIDPESHSIAAYGTNDELVFEIDYANSSLKFKGMDCSDGPSCYLRTINLDGSGLSFGDNSLSSYGAIRMKTKEVSTELLNTKSIKVTENAEISMYTLPDGDPSGVKNNFRLYVDKNGIVRGFPTTYK